MVQRALRGETQQWQTQIAAWRDSLGISAKCNLFEGLMTIKGMPVLTRRVDAILNLVTAEKCKTLKLKTTKTILKKLKDVIVDVSQNPARRNFTNEKGFVHTMCTSANMVHMGLQRVVLPREMLWLQGHNMRTTIVPKKMSQQDIRKLAGEGIATPCLGVCLWGLCVLKGFCKDV